ncbi:META domain-containing protein [bacterium]|nr:META domain-containing protein [bacterium]
MNIKALLLVTAVIMITGQMGCQRFFSVNNDHHGPDTIYHRVWNLESIKNEDGDTLFISDGNSEHSIKFSVDGSLSAVAACNTGEGNFWIQPGDSIHIQLACTEIACNTGYPGYCDDLNHATRFDLSDNTLSIYFTNRNKEKLVLIHK